jgi:uncharacterized RDD family membrane protein YckC
MPFAGLVNRFLATLVDACIVYVVVVAAGLAVDSTVGWRESIGPGPLLVLLAAWFTVFPATPLHGTPGKRMGGIKITDMQGNDIGIGRSLARFLLSLVTLATLGLGFIAASWNGKRQALHDLGARTLVVARKARPEEIAGAVAPPVWWFNRVLGFLGLVAVVTFAWFNVSTYKSMGKRTEITAAILAVQPFQKEVERAMVEGKPIPSPPSIPDRRIRALAVQPNGKVVIDLAEDVNPGGRISFTPTRTPKGIEWKCTSENIRGVHLGAICRE